MPVAMATDRQPAGTFSTQALSRRGQYEGWREAISATHLAWDLPHRSESAFNGHLRRQALGAADIIHCICDPCRGRRGRAEIARTEAASYGLLYIVGGRELVSQDGREADLAAGSFVLWDSQRRIDFQVPEGLRKITLMLPQPLLDPVLPNARDMTGMPVTARSGPGALLAAHLRTLGRQAATLSPSQQQAVLQGSLALLAAAFEILPAAAGASHQGRLLARIGGHIQTHLDDPELAPEQVADAIGISLRQLHRVFAASGWTVERWIWRQRLLRCRDDLALPGVTPVSQIAFRRGFSDAAHFSRAFRRAFGMSPKAWRAAHGSARRRS